MRIGVLDIQGSVEEHIAHLEKLPGVTPVRAKTEEELLSLDGLIIPGGESTAIAKMLKTFGILEPLKKRIRDGLPVYGTCAGMILLAREIEGEDSHLGIMDIRVRRNAYGSQMDSFVAEMPLPTISERPLPLVFIRAPYIVEHGEAVEVLSQVDRKIVAARQGNMLVSSFHPELTDSTDIHRYFCHMVRDAATIH